MTICAEKTVREYALETPNATRVFEKLKIDYCCGGGRPLGEAARLAGVPLGEVERRARLTPKPSFCSTARSRILLTRSSTPF